MKILGIETSCDETAAAIVEDGHKVLANIVKTQVEKHKEWGGVIPEMASRYHIEVIDTVVADCLEEAGLNIDDDIDAIAVTNGPGLIGSLLVGVGAAKALAWLHDKPIIAVNHLAGHIAANYLCEPSIQPPFLCLLVSGGHTQIIQVDSYSEFKVIGETIDDASGEAFDKVARLMDLPYPGGPSLDKLARTVDETSYKFSIPQVDGLDFSFSGIKTAALQMKQKLPAAEWEENKAQIAKAFQECIAEFLFQKLQAASDETGYTAIAIAGGVAANSAVRARLESGFGGTHQLSFPALKFCTDNAAMIAAAAYHNQPTEMDFEVFSRA